MIDLTPLEVRQKKGDFRRSFRGYDAELVNDFLDLVADRMEELVKQNMDLQDAVGDLRQELGDYRKKEQSLSDALMTAQQLRDDARSHAEKEGELLVREARLAAESARQEATKSLAREEETLRQVRARRGQLVESFRRMLERELNELEVIEQTLELKAEQAEARATTAAAESAPDRSEPEDEPAYETRPETESEPERESEFESEYEPQSEPEPEPEPKPDLEPEPEADAPFTPAMLGEQEFEAGARKPSGGEGISPEIEPATAEVEPASPDVDHDDGLLDIESFETEAPRPPRRKLGTSAGGDGDDTRAKGAGEAGRQNDDPADDEDDDLQEDWLKSLVEE